MSKTNTVTQGHIRAIMNESEFEVFTAFGKCTIVICKLPNGFILTESSACVDPVNYDEEMGEQICKERIENKLWELEGYLLQTDVYHGRS